MGLRYSWCQNMKKKKTIIARENYRLISLMYISSVFSRSVVSNSLWPHELQHARPPCPSPIPGLHSNSRPSSRWCHPTISSAVIPFSSCFQSFPASGSFPMSQFFTSGGQERVRKDNYFWNPCPSGISSFPASWERAHFRWLRGKEHICNAGDRSLISGPGRFPWRRKWQPTSVFLPEKCHGQRNLVTVDGVAKELDTKMTKQQHY